MQICIDPGHNGTPNFRSHACKEFPGPSALYYCAATRGILTRLRFFFSLVQVKINIVKKKNFI